MFDAEGACRWRAEARLWGRADAARTMLRGREGEDAGQEADADTCALRFPGQWEDDESGLHYNLNRYYDPDTGQYLSPIPSASTAECARTPMSTIRWDGWIP